LHDENDRLQEMANCARRGDSPIEPLRELPMDKIEFVHARSSPRLPVYARLLEERRRRRGAAATDAAKQAGSRNVFGPLMVEAGDADKVISGVTQHYPETIRPALQIVGTAPGVRRVSGLYVLVFKDRTFFFADTTVNIDPTAEDLAEIALLTADAVRRFDIDPRIAMISFSNFRSNMHASALKVKRAVEWSGRRGPTFRWTARCRPTTRSCPSSSKRSIRGLRSSRSRDFGSDCASPTERRGNRT
jgi:phosphotransacetylase